jgi:hypothetical protein
MNFPGLCKSALTLLLGALLLCGICRFIFRKKTMIGHAVSSSFAIIFIFVATVLIVTVWTNMSRIVSPLPFVSISANSAHFYTFQTTDYLTLCSEVLSMIILAFFVNLLDNWIPKGKNIISWFLLRVLTVVLGVLVHYLITWLFHQFLPQGIQAYAPAALLVILIVILLTGALKFIVGIFLTTINPVIAALYTFFFANIIGKQMTQAVLTTGMLAGSILLLQKFGITELSIASGALVAYIPFLIILTIVWYILNKLL